MQYNKYLNSDHWATTRKITLSRKGNYCKICEETKNIHVHHKTYKNKLNESILYKEKNYNLLPLCSICHGLWHAIYKLREIKPMDYVRAKLLLKLGATRKQAIMLCTDRSMGIEWLQNKLDQQIVFPRWGNATC